MTCTIYLSIVGVKVWTEIVSLDEFHEVRRVQQELNRSKDKVFSSIDVRREPGGGRYSDNRYSAISKWVTQWVWVRVKVTVRVS